MGEASGYRSHTGLVAATSPYHFCSHPVLSHPYVGSKCAGAANADEISNYRHDEDFLISSGMRATDFADEMSDRPGYRCLQKLDRDEEGSGRGSCHRVESVGGAQGSEDDMYWNICRLCTRVRLDGQYSAFRMRKFQVCKQNACDRMNDGPSIATIPVPFAVSVHKSSNKKMLRVLERSCHRPSVGNR